MYYCSQLESLAKLAIPVSNRFTTVVVNGTLVRECPLSFCGVGVRRLMELHWSFQSIFCSYVTLEFL